MTEWFMNLLSKMYFDAKLVAAVTVSHAEATIHLPASIVKSSYSRTGGFLGGTDFTACAIALH